MDPTEMELANANRDLVSMAQRIAALTAASQATLDQARADARRTIDELNDRLGGMVASLQAERDTARAERDEWQRKCTEACYDAAALELRRSELDAENEQLRAALALARNYQGVEAQACPLCRYAEGRLIEMCALHQEIERLRAALAEQWSPVESCAYVDANGVMVYVERRYYMELVKDAHEMVAILDDEHAFCERRAPAQDGPP